MSVFKQDKEIKRMIFNVYYDLAERLEALKTEAKRFDKRLDIDTAVNKALDKFITKAEKKLEEMKRETKDKRGKAHPEGCLHSTEDCPQDDGLESGIQTTDPAA